MLFRRKKIIFFLFYLKENDEIYMKNNFVKHAHENIETGILKASDKLFDGGKILDIGGVYRNRYAIVKH